MLVESHIITKVAGLKGALVSLAPQPLCGPCWVFLQIYRVNTCPDLVGPVGLEPTTKGLWVVQTESELVSKLSEFASFLLLIKVF